MAIFNSYVSLPEGTTYHSSFLKHPFDQADSSWGPCFSIGVSIYNSDGLFTSMALTDPLVQVWCPRNGNPIWNMNRVLPSPAFLYWAWSSWEIPIHWNWYPIGDWTPLPRLDSALGRWAGREAALVRLGFSMFFLGRRDVHLKILKHCDILRPMAGIVRNSPMRSFKEPLNKRSVVWRPPGSLRTVGG